MASQNDIDLVQQLVQSQALAHFDAVDRVLEAERQTSVLFAQYFIALLNAVNHEVEYGYSSARLRRACARANEQSWFPESVIAKSEGKEIS